MDIVAVTGRRENDFLDFRLLVRNAAGGVALRVSAGLVTKTGQQQESATHLGVMAPSDDPVEMKEIAVPADAVLPGWRSMAAVSQHRMDYTEECIFWVRYSNRFGETFLLKKVGPNDFPEISRVSD